MLVALNLETINNTAKKYKNDRLIGILIARYDTNKDLIAPNYELWNSLTGKHLDVFLAGYGSYISPDETNDRKKIIEFTEPNVNRVYFDTDAFVSIIRKLEQNVKKYNFKDTSPVLILLNVKNGKIIWKENLVVALMNDKKPVPFSMNSIMTKVSKLTEKYNSIYEISNELTFHSINAKHSLPEISISDLFTLITSII
ncbi:hypothetical protein [Enterococcus malodoratus]|uniref:hypothetical protein n=1 Tax=Enterococcus malodoratus TaxID=71451 RepID=UPI0022DF69CD|nr:hypothetical protein [Enterococcus malodoratus]